MAQLTRDQVKTWNQDNKNGFQLDIFYFLTHGEKTSIKHIEIDDTHVLTVTIMYRAEYETKRNKYGCKWNVETGRQIPNIHMNMAYKSGEMLVSNGLGYWKAIADARNNKSYKVLQSLTNWFDDAKCLAIFEELSKTQVNQHA